MKPELGVPRWAAPRERVIYGVNHIARRSVRDVVREARKDIRDRHQPVDPWMDACAAGRSGNHCADFMVRFAHLMQTTGECAHRTRERLVDLAHRIADAALHKNNAPARLQSPGAGHLQLGEKAA